MAHVPQHEKRRIGDFGLWVGYSTHVVQRVRRVFPRNASGKGLEEGANEGLHALDVRVYALGRHAGWMYTRTIIK